MDTASKPEAARQKSPVAAGQQEINPMAQAALSRAGMPAIDMTENGEVLPSPKLSIHFEAGPFVSPALLAGAVAKESYVRAVAEVLGARLLRNKAGEARFETAEGVVVADRGDTAHFYADPATFENGWVDLDRSLRRLSYRLTLVKGCTKAWPEARQRFDRSVQRFFLKYGVDALKPGERIEDFGPDFANAQSVSFGNIPPRLRRLVERRPVWQGGGAEQAVEAGRTMSEIVDVTERDRLRQAEIARSRLDHETLAQAERERRRDSNLAQLERRRIERRKAEAEGASAGVASSSGDLGRSSLSQGDTTGFATEFGAAP